MKQIKAVQNPTSCGSYDWQTCQKSILSDEWEPRDLVYTKATKREGEAMLQLKH
jgi:hypothetical protein